MDEQVNQTPNQTNCQIIKICKVVSCVLLNTKRYGLWRCVLGLCRSWSDRGVGFAVLVKRLYLQQLGHKTLRYFRMTQTK